MPLRKVSRCEEDLLQIIHKTADKLHLRDIEYFIDFGCDDVDIFLDGFYRVRIQGVRDGQKIKYHLGVMWHRDAKKRASFRALYDRAYIFYEIIVPKLLDIQRQFKAAEGLKMAFTNCVFASIEPDKETIVVLPDNQLQILNELQKTDLEHSTIVVKNLAKLHALSFALKQKDPKTFEEIRRLYSKHIQYSDTRHVSTSLECFYIDSASAVSDPIAKEKLKLLTPNILVVLNKCTKPGAYSVICHGDFWNSNILYRYKMGRPVEVVFIDYRMSRLASPVTDLSYYFYMTNDKEFLVKYYDRLLAIYYGTLTAVLRQCDLNVDEIYPKSVFEEHLRSYSVFGLIEALVSMKIITAHVEERLKLNESKCTTQTSYCDNESLSCPTEYIKRVNGVVDHFFERGYALDSLLISEE